MNAPISGEESGRHSNVISTRISRGADRQTFCADLKCNETQEKSPSFHERKQLHNEWKIEDRWLHFLQTEKINSSVRPLTGRGRWRERENMDRCGSRRSSPLRSVLGDDGD